MVGRALSPRNSARILDSSLARKYRLRHHQRRWAAGNLDRIMRCIHFSTPRLTVRPLCLEDYADVAKTSRTSLLSEEERSGNLLAISQRDSVSFARMVSFRSEAVRCGTLYVSGIFVTVTRDFVGDVLLCDFKGSSTPLCALWARCS
jgi:hypothetical protein